LGERRKMGRGEGGVYDLKRIRLKIDR
jgi:hypothetical protein